MKQAMTLITALVLLLAGTNLQTPQVLAQDDAQKMIPMRERVQIMQRFWEQKKETVLPMVMREQEIDMWIVRNDEQPEYRQASFKEGPFYTSLVPANFEGMVFSSRHADPLVRGAAVPSLLMFYDTGEHIDYLEPRDFAHITTLVRERDPQAIAIGQTNNEEMLAALAEYSSRTVDSWTLGVRWLSTMVPEQISIYRYVQGVANDIIAEGFSNQVIVPENPSAMMSRA